MKTQGADNHLTRQIQRWTRGIVSAQEYEEVVKELLRIALYGTKERDRLSAISMLANRIEGKVPDVVIISEDGKMTIADLLGRNNDKQR